MGKVLFLAQAEGASSGVRKKIEGIVRAICESGREAEAVFVYSKNQLGSSLFFARENGAGRVILRFPGFFKLIYLFPYALAARLKGTRLVLEIPTPLAVAVNELKAKYAKSKVYYLVKSLIYVFYPWALYPYNKILQYSNESHWFSFGVKKKSKLIANGVDVSTIKQRKKAPSWPNKTLVLLGVANVSYWHGYDRVIEGIKNYYEIVRADSDPDVEFLIVGAGAEIPNLMSLVEQYGLRKRVKFLGPLSGAELDEVYERAHIGIGSLGSYRKGLFLSSELKVREYCAVGIPFVLATNDPDFNEELSFIKFIPEKDQPLSIIDIKDWFDINQNSSSEIRKYAISFLDFSKKVDSYIG